MFVMVISSSSAKGRPNPWPQRHAKSVRCEPLLGTSPAPRAAPSGETMGPNCLTLPGIGAVRSRSAPVVAYRLFLRRRSRGETLGLGVDLSRAEAVEIVRS